VATSQPTCLAVGLGRILFCYVFEHSGAFWAWSFAGSCEPAYVDTILPPVFRSTPFGRFNLFIPLLCTSDLPRVLAMNLDSDGAVSPLTSSSGGSSPFGIHVPSRINTNDYCHRHTRCQIFQEESMLSFDKLEQQVFEVNGEISLTVVKKVARYVGKPPHPISESQNPRIWALSARSRVS
jgi:hypothetical protein